MRRIKRALTGMLAALMLLGGCASAREDAGAAVYITEHFELGVRVRLKNGQAELIEE